MKRCEYCNGVVGAGDDVYPKCEGSGSSPCSVPSPSIQVRWKWWKWNKVSKTWLRCDGTPDYASEEEAESQRIIYRKGEQVPILMREVTEFFTQNA